MKKQIALILLLGVLFSLCACGKSASEFRKPHNAPSDSSGNAMNEKEDNTETEAETTKNDSLSLLCMLQGRNRACATDSGCYYPSNDMESLSDGRYAMHLMYMDVAARQEIYLCNNAACMHNTVDCTSVLLTEDFPLYSTLLFVWNDNLYIMAKEQDGDGSTGTAVLGGGDAGIAAIESTQTILYRANLD